jgi:hypothetical protein
MEKFFIEPTKISPLVNFLPEEGIFELKGRSSPENPVLFFKPIYDVIDQYAAVDQPSLKVNLALDYFNTSSSKCIFELLKKISLMANNGKKIEINWMYDEDDEDILEAGEDFSSLTGMDFNYVGV